MSKLFLKNVQLHGRISSQPTCQQIKTSMLPSQCSQLKHSHPPCSQMYSFRPNMINSLEQTPTPNCSPQDANYIYNTLVDCAGCKKKKDNGLSGGAIAGIVCGSVVGLALIIFVIYKYKLK